MTNQIDMTIKQFFQELLSALAAGVAIAIGGTVYLTTYNAWCFSIGLLMVCFFNLNLYTGKIPFIKLTKNTWFMDIFRYLMMVTFNMIGAAITGILIYHIRPELRDIAKRMTELKLNYYWWIIIFKGMLCNVMIFAAVSFWKNGKNTVMKLTGLIFSTTIFVMCGFEHCVANAFYFMVAMAEPFDGFIWLNVLGNTIGGLAAYHLIKFINDKEPKKDELPTPVSNDIQKPD